LEPVERENAEDEKGKDAGRSLRGTRQRADQKRGQDGNADLSESHLEALIDPNGTRVRGENDQRDDDQEQDERPDIFGRKDIKHKGHEVHKVSSSGFSFVSFVSVVFRWI